MRRAFILLLVYLLIVPLPMSAGIDKNGARYVGGTVTAIPEGTEGKLDLSNKELFIFRWKHGEWSVPYKQVTSIEYGQKAGRRVGVGIMVTPWALFSKKRKHFLTLGFKDEEGQPQAALIEIGKAKTKVTLVVLEARTGMKCEYESVEAKKHVHG